MTNSINSYWFAPQLVDQFWDYRQLIGAEDMVQIQIIVDMSIGN